MMFNLFKKNTLFEICEDVVYKSLILFPDKDGFQWPRDADKIIKFWKFGLEEGYETHSLKKYGRIFNLNINWLPDTEVIINEKAYIKKNAELKFKYRNYVGYRSGSILVHTRKIKKSIEQKVLKKDFLSILDRETDDGLRFIYTFLPEAILRIGCNCCYGSGPNIVIKRSENHLHHIINFYIDFDFNIEMF